MTTSEDRAKALEIAFERIRKEHGKESISRLGDRPQQGVERFSSGSLSVDIALGGGFPKGRIIEVYGPEASGKTLICLSAVAAVQRAGGVAAFIDAEHALDPEWARKNGVDVENLIISQPDNGEQALQITQALVQSGAVDIIVVDSVAALVSQKELQGDIGDASMGVQARMMSQALRMITGTANNMKTTIMFVNQVRDKIGVVFGNPETTTGGKALKFYASVRLDVRRIETLKNGGDVVGARTRVKVVKNKVAPPFKQAEYEILFEGEKVGISREGDILDLGVSSGVLKKSGAWYQYADGRQLGQGKEKSRSVLINNPDETDRLEKEIRQELGIDPKDEVEGETVEVAETAETE